MTSRTLGIKLLEYSIKFVMIATALIMSYMSIIGVFNQAHAESAWQPTRPIEFVLPVGCCVGGANDMARVIKSIAEKYNLLPQPLILLNRPTGPGSEGYVYLKNRVGNPHVLGFAITSIFTQELANPKSSFNYTDLTPVAMMALDQFALWVNADAPYTTSQDFIANAGAQPGIISIGGLGVKQEDQILVAAMEENKSVQFNYIPYRVGGDIAVNLAGGQLDASVNNPSEGLAFWQAGKLKPLCVFDSQRMPNKNIIIGHQSWNSVPTCKEQGMDIQYKMMRSIFAAPGVEPEVLLYYQNFLQQVVATPEWYQYLEQNALENQFKTSTEFDQWLTAAYKEHQQIMINAGWISK